MKKWGDGDDPGEPKTAMDMVATLSSLNAEVLRCIRENEFYTGVLSRAADIVHALSAIPADAADRLVDAERRVKKMESALRMLFSGIRVQGMPEATSAPILKAIKRALE